MYITLDIKNIPGLKFCQILTAHLCSKGNVTEMVNVFIKFIFCIECILVMIHCVLCVCVSFLNQYFQWDFLILGNHIWQSVVNHNFDLHSISSLYMWQWHTSAPQFWHIANSSSLKLNFIIVIPANLANQKGASIWI